MATRPDDQQLTVDELARIAELPVRTIREYQTLRLLPPPRRAGRIGLYGAEHRERLQLIGRLQQRGYSLAGIKDLLEAWDSGANLPSLLGVDIGPGALDETPLRLTRRQLSARLSGLTATSLKRAGAVGLVEPDGPNHLLVRSPALLTLAADAVAAGVKLNDVLDLIGALRDELGALAETITQTIIERIWEPLVAQDRAAEIEPLLRRGRLLLLQGVVSTLADRLGDALMQQADEVPDGDTLRAAIEAIRVGVITDAAGNVRRVRPQP
jgi:DNA-binding transcriptional MerR regulator